MAKDMKMSAEDVRNYVSKVDFPAQKQDIINSAKKHSAPHEVVADLNGISDREYMDVDDVMKEIESREMESGGEDLT